MFGFSILNRRRTAADRWLSWKLNFRRLIIPLVFAFLVTVVWGLCRRAGWYLPHNAEVMVGTAILVLATVLAVAAGLMLNEVAQRSHELSMHILANRQHEFMLIRDERPPFAVSATLIVSGICVLILIGAAHYKTWAAGGIVVFLTAFALSMYVVVIKELQNPMASQWFVARIPPEWLAADIDEFFDTHVAKRRRPASKRPTA
jgi:hypothetical protein